MKYMFRLVDVSPIGLASCPVMVLLFFLADSHDSPEQQSFPGPAQMGDLPRACVHYKGVHETGNASLTTDS